MTKYYIEVSIDLFEEEISAKVSSLENKGLQNINENSTRLETKDADILHYIYSKLLWVKKRGRHDIDPTISFLCNRVTKSTKEDKEKLRRVFKHLKHTIKDKRIMESDSLSQIEFP